jgi:hypothetical protein
MNWSYLMAVVMVTRVRWTIIHPIFQDSLYLSHVHHWEEFSEEQEESEKQAQCANIDSNINPCWREHHPARGQVITVQGSDDNHETLEPHPNVHNNR